MKGHFTAKHLYDSSIICIVLMSLVRIRLSSSCIYSPPIKDLHPPGLTTQIPVGQMPVGGAVAMDQNTRQIHKGGPP